MSKKCIVCNKDIKYSTYCSPECSFNNNYRLPINDTDCWIWLGKTDKDGYPQNLYGFKGGKAHRFICEKTHGPAPDGKNCALHSCDNPTCVNPKHLRWGSMQDNMDDMISRGRKVIQIGEEASSAKLTEEEVIEIKKELKKWKPGDDPRLAKLYNVNRETIRAIRLNKNWKHVKLED